MLAQTRAGATVHTDEWGAYARLPEHDRRHATVCHNPARPGGPCNTMEGTWTGLRNFLRPFRGVAKTYRGGYVAMFEWAHNVKAATAAFLRSLLTPKPSTS